MRGGEIESLANDEGERENRVGENVTVHLLGIRGVLGAHLFLLVLGNEIDESALAEAVVVGVGCAAAENAVRGIRGRQEVA